MIGLFSIWQGPPNAVCAERGIQKRNEVLTGFSRDGFHWHRPDRRPFLPENEEEGAWNWGNVQSAGGGLVVGDQLYFYVSGRGLTDKFWDGNVHTGLATLRRDGFASLDAGEEPGTLTTRPVRFSGKHLLVNVAAAEGELRCEVIGDEGRAIEPFTMENCTPLSSDDTQARVEWRGADDLSAVAGQTVRLRFKLRSGELYAFWVSQDAGAESGGYVNGKNH